jgi:RNA polymerase sigma-70 factor (ECF subfamily)
MNLGKAALSDRQALFQTKIEQHQKILFKVVGTYAWQPEDQQDLAQEILIQLWQAFPKYDQNRVFSTWMYQVALNTAISWSRKAQVRNRHTTTVENITEIPAERQDHLDSQALYQLIHSLDELSRALLMLYIEERSHAEIGEILGISPANVATKISRLKERLRLEVEQQP